MLGPEEGQRTLTYVILASIAGLLGYLMRVIERGGKIRWLVAGLEACSSGFVGYLTMLTCRAMGLSYEWTGVIVGLLGWLGAAASVRIIENIIRKRLGIYDENPFPPGYNGDDRANPSDKG